MRARRVRVTMLALGAAVTAMSADEVFWRKPPEGEWPRAGVVAFTVRLDAPLYPARTAVGAGRILRQPLLEVPTMRLTLGTRPESVYLEIEPAQAAGGTTRGRLDLTHLKAEVVYEIALAWDADHQLIRCFLNGVEQGDLFHTLPLDWVAPPRFAGVRREFASDAIGFVLGPLRFREGVTTATEIKASLGSIARLTGEGRTPAAKDGLNLAGLHLTPVWQPDLTDQPLVVVTEDSLFDGKERVRVPAAGEWVLEGPGRADLEDGAIVLAAADPAETRRHLVLWPNRRFPADFLLEYTFSPEDPGRGLHILFFNTQARAEGGSIFAPGLPHRDGIFSTYTNGALDGYHLSSMSTDRWGKLRRTSNLRKNWGFVLATAGDDLIGGTPGPHRLRLLKHGGAIRFEVNGRLALAWDDDGVNVGPVHTHDGYLGFRIMAHTGRVWIRDLRMWRVEAMESPSLTP